MNLEERVMDLESRLAFQDDAIEAMNDVLVVQQRVVERLIHHPEAAHTEQPHDLELSEARAHGQRVDMVNGAGDAGAWNFGHGQSGDATHCQEYSSIRG